MALTLPFAYLSTFPNELEFSAAVDRRGLYTDVNTWPLHYYQRSCTSTAVAIVASNGGVLLRPGTFGVRFCTIMFRIGGRSTLTAVGSLAPLSLAVIHSLNDYSSRALLSTYIQELGGQQAPGGRFPAAVTRATEQVLTSVIHV